MTRSPESSALGRLIRVRRLRAAVTQAQLGKACGVSQTCVSKWEAGWLIPDALELIAAADLLGFNLDDVRTVAA